MTHHLIVTYPESNNICYIHACQDTFNYVKNIIKQLNEL